MKIAIVGPSPVPFAFGGVESLLGSLRDQIVLLTSHYSELIKLPSRERSFWDIVDSYRQFWALDLSHFDLVISTKYPAWMVRHPRHICYMQHRLRGLYDAYYLSGKGTEIDRDCPAVDSLVSFMDRKEGSTDDVLPGFFSLLERLRDADVPRSVLEFPGPLIRRVVHFLDNQALALRRIRRFCAISATVARRPDYFPAGARVAVVHHPSHLSGFRDTGSDYFFTVSRLDRPKRVDLLVQAMRQIRARIPFRVGGTGEQATALRQMAQGDDRIEFLGFLSDDDLVAQYGGARSVLYVPHEEDYGLVTIEAMMSGKPVITCADSGGPLEFVEDGHTGAVVPPDALRLAAAMDDLAADIDRARSLGQTAHERVRYITWKRTIGILLDGAAEAAPPRTIVERERSGVSRSQGRDPHRRPRLTVAVPFPVYPPVGGGQQRVYGMYRHVAQAFDVELVTLGAAGSVAFDGEIANGLREIRIPKSDRHQNEEDVIARSAMGVLVGDIAVTLLLQYTPEYIDRLASSLSEAGAVVASHPYCLPAIEAVRSGQPLIYEAHNVEVQLKQAALRELGAAGAELVNVGKEVESEACRKSAFVLVCSAEDGQELARLYGLDAARIVLAPNGVDVDAFRFVNSLERDRLRATYHVTGPRIGLFVGSWHPPNLEASAAVFEIARAVPDMAFLIVGSLDIPLSSQPRPRNVALMGVVDDETLKAVMTLAHVALNPMRSGSGTNLKLATYAATGLPVVTTLHGARGYGLSNREHAMIGPVEEFPAMVAELFGTPGLGEAMSRRARRHIEEAFDWRRIADQVVSAISPLLGVVARPRGVAHDLAHRVAHEMADLGIAVTDPLVASVAEHISGLRGPDRSTPPGRRVGAKASSKIGDFRSPERKMTGSA